MSTDPAYFELLYLEEAAREYADHHPELSEEDAKAYIWGRAGREL
jgi:hypothetical protein